ncbi:MAG: PQQ-binding-like beta-propeller repeat protein [Phycisphaera sp.]|nr:PQQ-binding-like beta-propeller repeat protein [Phycisphaera sp.]
MKTRMLVFAVVLVVCARLGAAPPEIEGGVVVCLGGKALDSVSEAWKAPGYTIQCLETSDDAVAALRKKIQAAGCYGKVSVMRFDGVHLPYINNLVNTIVIADDRCKVPAAEVARALAPYGVAIAPKGSTSVPPGAKPAGDDRVRYTKPYPKNMDEWPQYLHGSDNNCVAQDTVVGPPRHLQWTSGPAWTRSHMGAASITSMVSSGGRLFTIEDTETAENPYLPAKWKLVARGAFNGVKLWTLDIPEWENIMVYVKDYPSQMQRRLVAIGDTVYFTPGLTAPLTALDAATGKTLRTFEGTGGTVEFAYHDGKLYAVIGDRMRFSGYGTGSPNKNAKGDKKGKNSKNNKPQDDDPNEDNDGKPDSGDPNVAFKGYGFTLAAYNRRTGNVEKPMDVIAAFDAKTGKELWRSEPIADFVGTTMAIKDDRLIYQSGHGVFCLNANTGKENWSVKKEIEMGWGQSPATLVIGPEAVYSEEGNGLHAYRLTDGSPYWKKPIPAAKGYRSSTDVLIAQGKLWMCGGKSTPTSYDLKTGEQIKRIDQTLSKPMGHDRCFRNFITERFYIDSKTGGPDCLDLAAGTEYPNPFTRATCSMGVLPCNGLTYLGPFSCQCHTTVSLNHFNAYYTDEDALPTDGQIVKVERRARLEKGPAFGFSVDLADTPWPTYRGDDRRYGLGSSHVPGDDLKPVWKTTLSAVGSAPVIAESKVFVAEKDAHTLRALDADTGKLIWRYVAGGRIDSPPTYYHGLVLFGSCDGWVYCVRASDGALSWRFRDLPERQMCAFDQLESAWPVHGSILVTNDTAYFCAGRASHLDGGIFIYGLDAVTGELKHQRQFYGPYAHGTFAAFERFRADTPKAKESNVVAGTTADVMTCEGDTLYIRHEAFHLDLTDATAGKHLLSTAGMLESQRQHREYSLIAETFNGKGTWTTDKTDYPTGDILTSDGKNYFSVFGMPVNRHSFFDPRKDGYTLTARTLSSDTWSEKWRTHIPITGKTMTVTDNTVFITGAPLVFPTDDLGGTYAGRQGGVLWAASADDGSKIAEYKLDQLPVWDGVAAAYHRLYIVNQDGSIMCMGGSGEAK